MPRSLSVAMGLCGALVLGALLGGGALPARADRGSAGPAGQSLSEMAPPHDPKKKNAGDACKTSDECQPHHTCTKVGDKSVCKAPPRPSLPPGAVT